MIEKTKNENDLDETAMLLYSIRMIMYGVIIGALIVVGIFLIAAR